MYRFLSNDETGFGVIFLSDDIDNISWNIFMAWCPTTITNVLVNLNFQYAVVFLRPRSAYCLQSGSRTIFPLSFISVTVLFRAEDDPDRRAIVRVVYLRRIVI